MPNKESDQVWLVKFSDGTEQICSSLTEALDVAWFEMKLGLDHDIITPDGQTIWVDKDKSWEYSTA